MPATKLNIIMQKRAKCWTVFKMSPRLW